MSISISDIEYYQKECYDGQTVATLVPKGNPLLDMLRKNPNMGGKRYPLPATTSSSQGIAGKFSTAQSRAGAGTGVEFLLTHGRDFMVYRIEEEAIRTSEKSSDAFMSALDKEMADLMVTYGINMSQQVWSNGGAPAGQRASISSNTVTLSRLADAYNFHEGMSVVGSAGDGSSTSHTVLTGSTTVASVDREAGTVTLADASQLSGFSDNHYLFREGEFQGNPATTGVKHIVGIDGWIPASAPTSTSFFGVDRTGDTRLSGTRIPAAQQIGGAVERIRRMAAFSNTVAGCMGKHCFVSPMQWEVISIVLGQKGYSEISLKNSTGTFGYGAMEFNTAYGKISIVADRHCPDTTAFLLNLEELELLSVGPFVDPLDRGGTVMFHVSDEASWERRWISLCQLKNTNTGQHARCPLPAVS